MEDPVKGQEKKRRGGQRKIDPSDVLGTAHTLREQFSAAWPKLGELVLAAKTAVDVWEAIKSGDGIINNLDFTFAQRVFEIIRDPKFPRRRAKSQISFLSDSLGGCGLVTARRSREICAKERKKVRHVIVRREFYIECTCKYQGPAQNGACPKCSTGELSEELLRREHEQ